MFETWVLIRVSILPIRERIRIIAATPIEIPRQVKNERALLRFREAFASSRWVFKSSAINVYLAFLVFSFLSDGGSGERVFVFSRFFYGGCGRQRVRGGRSLRRF